MLWQLWLALALWLLKCVSGWLSVSCVCLTDDGDGEHGEHGESTETASYTVSGLSGLSGLGFSEQARSELTAS